MITDPPLSPIEKAKLRRQSLSLAASYGAFALAFLALGSYELAGHRPGWLAYAHIAFAACWAGIAYRASRRCS